MRSSGNSLATRIRRGEPIPWPVGVGLSALTPLWRLGMWRRLRQPEERVEARVISFGNITAGGTGKTPAVIERARAEVDAGHRVAVITRGHGSEATEEPLALTADEAGPEVYRRIGDEPALILRRVPEALIVKSRDRVAGARLAVDRYGCDTLILDDAYQAVRLARDENVLVIDASNPFGSGHILPRGILREPLAAMGRATHVLLTRCDQAKDLPALEAVIEEHCPGIPVRGTRHAPDRLWRVRTGEALPLDHLQGLDVIASCGIGNPEAFQQTLMALGAKVTLAFATPDHTPAFVAGDQRVTTVVTEKDAVRMADPPENVLALGIELADVP